jgi:FkbM family methyltransferase
MNQINHLAQADMEWDGAHRRFWMDTCAGRDQVAMTMLQSGWAAYEPPLPALVAQWCHALRPVFVDVGANTGFYSLLALAAGARHAHAFEPVAEIAAVARSNALVSEVTDRLSLHVTALGETDGEATLYFPLAHHGLVETSASLNPQFRTQHAEQRQVRVARLDSVLLNRLPAHVPLLVKIDVESREPAVLKGAPLLLKTARPALVCELLPGCDMAFFNSFCHEYNYTHFALDSGAPVECALQAASDTHRDHLFLPAEQKTMWLAPVANEVARES